VTRRNVGSDGRTVSVRLLPFDSVPVAVGAQTLAFTDRDGMWLVRYPVRISTWFVFGREIRTKTPQPTRRARCGSRDEDCSICRLIYPLCRKQWAELSGILTYPDPGRLQRRLLRRRGLSESGLYESGSSRFDPVFLAQGGGAKRFLARGRETNLLSSVIFDGKCYFSELPQLVVYQRVFT